MTKRGFSGDKTGSSLDWYAILGDPFEKRTDEGCSTLDEKKFEKIELFSCSRFTSHSVVQLQLHPCTNTDPFQIKNITVFSGGFFI